jgi:hypothetical protein
MTKNAQRLSQVVSTFGPGAMVDLPTRSVVIGGLEVVKIIAARGAAQLRRPGLLERQLKHGDAVRRQAWSSKAFVATILAMLVFFAIFLRLPPNKFLRIPPDLSPVSIRLALLFLLLTRS